MIQLLGINSKCLKEINVEEELNFLEKQQQKNQKVHCNISILFVIGNLRTSCSWNIYNT